MELIDLTSVTVRELWDAISRVDHESVCPGVLFNKITHAIYENRMFGEYKDPNIGKEVSNERLTPYFTPPDMALVGEVTKDIFRAIDKQIKMSEPD